MVTGTGPLGSKRAQGHTLEAVAAAFMLIASISFALQMTAVTPLSASTSSQHLENQLRFTGAGVLASAQETGDLSRALRYWNDSNARFHNSSDGGYYTSDPPTKIPFGRALDRTFDDRNVAYNVYLVYEEDDSSQTDRMIYRGEPSDHAVRASRTVTIMEHEPLIDEDGTVNGTVTVSDADTYSSFLPDSAEDRPVYNVVRVEVVAWRI